MSSRSRVAVIVVSLLLLSSSADADSPQFRGPERNGVFPATGLLEAWPAGGPEMLWSTDGLGTGFARIAIVDGRIFTTGEDGGEGSVHAFDLSGKHLWSTSYGELHDGDGYPGTRTTPTFDDGLVYIM